jgi:hypothetical protein
MLMKSVLLTLTVVVLLSAAAFAESHPPHVGPPAAEVSAPSPLAAVGGEHPAQIIADWQAWTDGVAREAWYEGVAEAARVEAAALADLARQRPVRSSSGSVGSGDCAQLAQQLGLPEHILWRESRCSTDAYNATGCGGRGCLGAAQIDQGHFAAVSPWNPDVPGTCYGLSYQECVDRLWNGGAGAGHWR